METIISLVAAWAPPILFVLLFVVLMQRSMRRYVKLNEDAVEAVRENTTAIRELTAALAKRRDETGPPPV